jgi:hypothetical protein
MNRRSSTQGLQWPLDLVVWCVEGHHAENPSMGGPIP